MDLSSVSQILHDKRSKLLVRMGGNPSNAIGLYDQNMQKIDEFIVKLSEGVQTLGNKYLVLIDDSSETKNENTKYIMYDM